LGKFFSKIMSFAFRSLRAGSLTRRSLLRRPTGAPLAFAMTRGQVSVILIFIIAVVFIFFAVILNLGKVSQLKNTTTIAANVGAASLASQYASYAEMLYQVELGGDANDGADDDLTKCGWVSITAILLSIIIMIVAYMTGQVQLLVFVIALIASIAALAMQAMVIQPGLTDLWNKQLQRLGPIDQVVERGLQVTLQNVVNDAEETLDVNDMDMDGLYIANSNDHVNRFGNHYALRLDGLKGRLPDSTILKNFLARLEQFLYEDNILYPPPSTLATDNWGIWDPVRDFSPLCQDADGNFDPACNRDLCLNASGDINPSAHPCCRGILPGTGLAPYECNECCLPAGSPPEPALRPAECDTDPQKSNNCPAKYPYIFDPHYENRTNTFESFREFLGHDDEYKDLKKDWGHPLQSPDDENFYQEDDPLGDYRSSDATGLFSVLWDISEHAQLRPRQDNYEKTYQQEKCFWCDSCAAGTLAECKQYYCESADAERFKFPGCSGVNCCVDVPNNTVLPRFDNVLNADMETLVPIGDTNGDGTNDGFTLEYRYMNILKRNPAGQGRCYLCSGDTTFCSGVTSLGWWKNGADEFCSKFWPYDANCAGKHCPKGCGSCTIADASIGNVCTGDDFCYMNSTPVTDNWPEDKWREDEVDEVKDGLDSFIDWANGILDTDMSTLATMFISWYPEAHQWFGPGALPEPPPPAGLPGGSPPVVTVLDRLGVWEEYMRGWVNILQNWRTQNAQNTVTDMSTLCFPRDDQDEFTVAPPPCPDIDGDGIDDCRDTANIEEVTDCLVREAGKAMIAGNKDLADKLIFRANFLKGLAGPPSSRGRVDIAIDKLTSAIKAINEFRNSDEVKDLRDEYARLITAAENGLPAVAIYVWQSDPAKGETRGPWHVVRVDAMAPGRCDGQCGRQNNFGLPATETRWPTVETYTHSLGLRRCYTLFDSRNLDEFCDDTDDYRHQARQCFRGGTTKVRVVRYDEERDGIMRFANLVSIWNFIFHHPLRGSGKADIPNMEAACGLSADDAARMLNSRNDNPDCWGWLNKLLERGVMSQSCAEYFFHPPKGIGAKGGFGVKFTNCDSEFRGRPLD